MTCRTNAVDDEDDDDDDEDDADTGSGNRITHGSLRDRRGAMQPPKPFFLLFAAAQITKTEVYVFSEPYDAAVYEESLDALGAELFLATVVEMSLAAAEFAGEDGESLAAPTAYDISRTLDDDVEPPAASGSDRSCCSPLSLSVSSVPLVASTASTSSRILLLPLAIEIFFNCCAAGTPIARSDGPTAA